MFLESKFLSLGAKEISHQIRENKISCIEVLEEALNLAKDSNKNYNCVTQFLFKAAFDQAQKFDKLIKEGYVFDKEKYPLLGIPISVKDYIHVKDYDTVAGLQKNLNKPQTQDALLIKQLKDMGAIIYCKTNVTQLGCDIECSNPIYGKTLNPHNIKYTSGGTTGGEAALISSGASILGIGTDIGGSLRFPAHFCGIYSFKPTSNRFSTKGDIDLFKGFRALELCFGFLSKSMDTIELAFKSVILNEPWKLDFKVINKPYNEYIIKKKMRFGYYFSDGMFPVTPAIERGIRYVLDALKAEGHEVVEYLPIDIDRVFNLNTQILVADGLETVKKNLSVNEPVEAPAMQLFDMIKTNSCFKIVICFILKLIGQEYLANSILNFRKSSVEEFYKLVNLKDELIQEVEIKWDRTKLDNLYIDAIICPVSTLPAHKHGDYMKVIPGMRYSNFYNVLDYPTGVIPVTKVDKKLDIMDNNWIKEKLKNPNCWTAKQHYSIYNAEEMHGLPVGVQIVTRKYEEEKLISIMKYIDLLLNRSH